MSRYLRMTIYTAFLLLILTGCQKETSLSIEVFEFQTDEYIETIKDEDVIKDLIGKLEKAEIVRTEMMDFVLPEYKLIFKNNDKILYELGYYQESLKFGDVEGHYWSQSEDKFYGVKVPLNFEH